MIDRSDLNLAYLYIRALSHKLRRDIISILLENDEMTVTDLYIRFRIEQSVMSQHLRVLRDVNIIKGVKIGKFIYYNINKEELSRIERSIKILVNEDTEDTEDTMEKLEKQSKKV